MLPLLFPLHLSHREPASGYKKATRTPLATTPLPLPLPHSTPPPALTRRAATPLPPPGRGARTSRAVRAPPLPRSTTVTWPYCLSSPASVLSLPPPVPLGLQLTSSPFPVSGRQELAGEVLPPVTDKELAATDQDLSSTRSFPSQLPRTTPARPRRLLHPRATLGEPPRSPPSSRTRLRRRS